jgi:conserved oligomeric Golgi complex subunit 6
MAASPFSPGSLTPTGASSPPGTPGAGSTVPARSGALLSRITTILSASYADLGIRDALETLDARKVENTPETRRQLRLDVQHDVIKANGDIVRDFGEVAEVGLPSTRERMAEPFADMVNVAIETSGRND